MVFSNGGVMVVPDLGVHLVEEKTHWGWEVERRRSGAAGESGVR